MQGYESYGRSDGYSGDDKVACLRPPDARSAADFSSSLRHIRRIDLLQQLLRKLCRIVGQVCRDPHDAVSVRRSDRVEPIASVPIATLQQRLQLGQLFLKKISRVG